MFLLRESRRAGFGEQVEASPPPLTYPFPTIWSQRAELQLTSDPPDRICPIGLGEVVCFFAPFGVLRGLCGLPALGKMGGNCPTP